MQLHNHHRGPWFNKYDHCFSETWLILIDGEFTAMGYVTPSFLENVPDENCAEM